MIIKSLKSAAGFKAGGASFFTGVLHPDKEPLAIGYSLAHAVVKPGGKTLPHRLRSAEVYCIVEGRGLVHVGSERAEVEAGQAVYIPPGEIQHIENPGGGDLAFLCIADPAWRAEDEETSGKPDS